MTGRARDVGIVGGGILGLTLALRLVDDGARVTIYERSEDIGGLAASARFGDVTWDRFYHVILQSDTALLSLLDRLDLAVEVQWRATGTGLFDGGQLYPVSTTLDYLRLPVLGLAAKARIAATMVRAASIRSSDNLEQITARRWLSRWSGNKAYDRFWAPLLRSKLGDRYEDASAAFIWAIMQRLYEARRAGGSQDLFGYVPGGYATILDRLEKELRAGGVEMRLGVKVTGVTSNGTGGVSTVHTVDSDIHHDAVIVTAASPIAARLIPGMSMNERAAHTAIPYQGVVCVSLLLRRKLSDFYVTNIIDRSIPFTGVIEMSALVDPVEFGNRALVYLPKYVAPDDPMFDRDDASIVEEFFAALEVMHGDLEWEDIAASVVSRARYVLPVSTVGYSTRLPTLMTSVSGVAIVNTAHIVNGTLNANETIELADRAHAALGGLRSSGIGS